MFADLYIRAGGVCCGSQAMGHNTPGETFTESFCPALCSDTQQREHLFVS
jgi:hypothetical protein